jgi:ActR/RegA family two-component response regulator
MTTPPLALIADSDRPFRIQLAKDLDQAGYCTNTHDDLEGALAQASEAPPALVVTELWFPDAGGLEVVARWTSALPAVPVIVVTGSASIDLAVAALRAGATNVLTKPVTGSEVLAEAQAPSSSSWPSPRSSVSEAHTLTIAQATEAYLRAMVAGSRSLREAARRLGLDRRSLRRILDRYEWAPRQR